LPRRTSLFLPLLKRLSQRCLRPRLAPNATPIPGKVEWSTDYYPLRQASDHDPAHITDFLEYLTPRFSTNYQGPNCIITLDTTRTTDAAPAIPNGYTFNFDAPLTEACQYPEQGTWLGFKNIDKDGKSSENKPGNARYWWMEKVLVDVFTTSLWRS